jgi:hypothetical protein
VTLKKFKVTKKGLQNGIRTEILYYSRAYTEKVFGTIRSEVRYLQKDNDKCTTILQHEIFWGAVMQKLPEPSELSE